MILASLISQGVVIFALLWFIWKQDEKHNQRVDQLLTWIKDTPTAVVRADDGPTEKIVPTVMDDERMADLEAAYESEEASAGPDDN
jgi:hypothetical protein